MRAGKIIVYFLGLFLPAFTVVSSLNIYRHGFVHENAEIATIVFLSSLSLFYSMYVNMSNLLLSRQAKKTKIVTGTSYLDLQNNINSQLKDMKKKSIVNVQIKEGFCALILYTD